MEPWRSAVLQFTPFTECSATAGGPKSTPPPQPCPLSLGRRRPAAWRQGLRAAQTGAPAASAINAPPLGFRLARQAPLRPPGVDGGH